MSDDKTSYDVYKNIFNKILNLIDTLAPTIFIFLMIIFALLLVPHTPSGFFGDCISTIILMGFGFFLLVIFNYAGRFLKKWKS